MLMVIVTFGYLIFNFAAVYTAYNLYEKVANRIPIFESIPLEWKIETIIMAALAIFLFIFILLINLYIILG